MSSEVLVLRAEQQVENPADPVLQSLETCGSFSRLVGGANRSGVIRTMIRLMSNDDD
jgi:hypothetical protein